MTLRYPNLCQSNTRTASLQSVKTPTSQGMSWYDTKQSDTEASVMLELSGMPNTPSLALLPGPLWPEVVASDSVLSMGLLELNHVLRQNWIVWNKTVFDI